MGVEIGGVICGTLTVVSSTTITCLTGAHAEGLVDVKVKKLYIPPEPDEEYSATLTNGYYYLTTTSGSTFIDGGGETSNINVSTAKSASTPMLVEYNAKIYAVWSEPNSSGISQIRVKEYNNGVWSFMADDGQTSEKGINVDNTMNAINPYAIVFNNELYVIWSERFFSVVPPIDVYQIRIKHYNPTYKWQLGDGGSALNADSSKDAKNPSLVVHDLNLYATWAEMGTNNIYQIRVKKYSASSWSFVDDDGIYAGINKNENQNADLPKATSFSSKLYVTWKEKSSGTYDSIRCKEWNGTDWTIIDGDTLQGLNIGTNNADSPFILVHNSNLFVIWAESSLIKVAKYESGSSWDKTIGGTGLNKNASFDAKEPKAVSSGSTLYVTWVEVAANVGAYNVRASAYFNNSWSFIDGNGVTGINYNTSLDAANPFITLINTDLYFAWVEGVTAQFRAKKSN